MMITILITAGGALAGDISVVPASLSPEAMEQRLATPSSQPKLTNEFLAAYVARQQALKNVDYFDVPQLTETVLLGYIARRQNPALAAIEGADRTDATGLTGDMLAAYASSSFVPTEKKIKLADGERHCLSQALYYEARGESHEGQLAVANIILNRAMSEQYPSTICGVVYQNANKGKYQCQFTFACDGRDETIRERSAWNQVQKVADEAFADFQRGKTPGILPKSAMFYHTTSVAPSWSQTFKRVAAIGSHVFYAKR